MRISVLMERLQAALVHDVIDVIIKLFLRDQLVLSDRFSDYFAYRHSRRQ